MKFRFEAFDVLGNVVQGEIDAGSGDEAREAIWARGVTPYNVRSSRASDLFFGEMRLDSVRRQPTDKQLARLTRDLAVLLEAGVPLEAALRIGSTTSEDARMRRLALGLLEGVLEGASLAEVMQAMPGTFRMEYVKIVQAGELGADLGGALRELADLLDRRVEVRSRIRGALAYPSLLLALAAVSLWIVLGLLIPAVTPIFRENGMPLPRVVAALDWLRENSVLLVTMTLSCAFAAWLGILAARRNAALRVELDKLFFSVPIAGRISELREAARFTRTLAAMIRAGVAPLQALQAACPLVWNHHTRRQLDRALADVRAGASIGSAITKFAALPSVAQQMIVVGEESGRLHDMLLRAASTMERQEQARTDRMLAVLTPAVTLLVGGMISAIILSVMGAILSMNELALL